MRHRLLGAATLVALTIATMSGAHARAQADPASRALEYLRAQQLADGSIPAGAFGGYTPTEMYVIAAASAGYDPAALGNGGVAADSFLKAHAADASSTPARAGLLTQAIVAAHLDPTSFGGVNIIATMTATYHATTGAYGDGQLYTQAYAILGLRAAALAIPVSAYAYLESLQDSDGGWNYSATANNSAGSDSNSTALAMMVLGVRHDVAATSATAAAVTWLHTQQAPGGGFGSQPAWGVDADSTALVIQALIASGENPDASTWTSGGVSAFSALLTQQDGGGGFGYQGAPVDAYTTAQATLGLVVEPLPGSHVFAPGYTMAGADASAVKAVTYLAGQLRSDGALPGFGSTADTGATCDLVIAAAAAGIDPLSLHGSDKSPVDFLHTAASDPAVLANAGRLAKVIAAAVADRGDPAHFAGKDLIAALSLLYNGTTGAYGNGQTMTQSLAILALAGAARPVPDGALTYLEGLRNADGGWGWNNTAAANAVAGSDTNSTAMALMALNAAAHLELNAHAVTWLHAQQESDGGFGYQAAWGTDVDSTALVIQALVAVHQNPTGGVWAQSGTTPVMNLAAAQESGGGYGYQGAPADVFTTSQVPPGLLRAAFPVTPRFPVGGVVPPVTITPSPTIAAVTPTPVPAVPSDHTGSRATVDASPVATPTPTAPPPTPDTSPSAGVEGVSTGPAPAVAAPATASSARTETGSAWAAYLLAGAAGLLTIGGGGAVFSRRRRP